MTFVDIDTNASHSDSKTFTRILSVPEGDVQESEYHRLLCTYMCSIWTILICKVQKQWKLLIYVMFEILIVIVT